MNKRNLVLSVILVLCCFSAAQANPLNLTVPDSPWVLADGVRVVYTLTGATPGHLYAYGSPTTYNDGPESSVELDPYYSSFELNVDLYTNGQFISGSLALSGAVYEDNNPTPPTLFYSTTLTALGYGTDDKFEFLFTQDGPGVPPLNAPIGVILMGTSIPGEPNEWFSVGFENYYNGQADVFGYVPEPASMSLLVLGGLALLRRRDK